MSAPDRSTAPEAVLLDLDDVLVPFHTTHAWQWAWHPQGPALGERKVTAALRRSLHAWDRRRWEGVAGRAPPCDLDALKAHLATTLHAIAGRALPPEETDAVVRRVLRPAGEIERFSDVAPFLARLGAAGIRVGVVTPLPADSARWLVRRIGLPEAIVVASDDGSARPLPDRDAFRAAVARVGAAPATTVFVGDLYWSDVRAAHRAGLTAVLLDRRDFAPQVEGARRTTLEGFTPTVAASGDPGPAEPEGSASATPAPGERI